MVERGFANANVLIVEDEPFIALDLVEAVKSAGGLPGPAATIAEALLLISSTDFQAAILDINLPDGDIEPVLAALYGDTAIVLHTGVGLPPEIRAKYPAIPVYGKSIPSAVLTTRAIALLRGSKN